MLGLPLTGCPDDAEQLPNCGPGTVLVIDQCVPAGSDSGTPDGVTQPDSTTGDVPTGDGGPGDATGDIPAGAVALPFAIDDYYVPSGFMGDGESGGLDASGSCSQRAGDEVGTCHAFAFTPGSNGWAGVWWQYPDGNWGDSDGLVVAPGATAVTFWAWSDVDGLAADFFSGYASDGFEGTESATLTTTPQEITIIIAGGTYTDIAGGFGWSAASASPYTIYIDDIEMTNASFEVPGCTDDTADNYNPAATVDDGSCIFGGEVSLPFAIDDYYFPSGFMGDQGGIVMDDSCPNRAGDELGSCHAVTFTPGSGGWGGVFWQYPENNWKEAGDPPGLDVADGATKITFWAWGATGGEVVTFGAGYAADGFERGTGEVTLTTTPTEYTIDLTGATYTEIAGAFSWVSAAAVNFFIDDIEYSNEPPPAGSGCTDSDATNYDAAATTDDGSCTYNVTFNVDMNCAGVSYTSVGLSGPFCSWCSDIVMTDDDSDGIFTITLELGAGPTEYKYIIDGFAGQEDLIGAGACAAITDGSTYANREVTVVDAPVTLDEVYGQCEACGVTPPTGDDILLLTFDDAASTTGWNKVADATNAEATVAWSDTEGNPPGALALAAQNPAAGAGKAYIFQYDATGLNYGGATDVTVSFDVRYPPGSPLVGSALHLQTNAPGPGVVNTFDIQNSGITDSGWTNLSYDISGVTPGATTFSIHFNIAAGGDQDAGGTVWIDNVRLAAQGATGPTGCTDSNAKNYDSGAATDDGSCLYDVTFNVDMNCTTDTYTTVGISGPFCSWCSDIQMTDDDSDGIYSITLEVGAGAFEYKYIVDGFAGQEDLVGDAGGCVGNTDGSSFANRVLTADGTTLTLNDTYGQCQACPGAGDVLGCTNADAKNYNSAATIDDGSCLFDVTFNVDMSCAGVSYSSVGITGPFCSWCGDIVMTDDDNDDIYTITLELGAGDVEYKYIIDGFAGQEDLIGDAGACVGNTDGSSFANRVVTVAASQTLDETYGQCDACGGSPPTGDDILLLTFDDAGSIAGWNEVADATGAEATVAWSDVEGNPPGAMALSAQNPAQGAGKAYIFQYDATGLDYANASDVTVSFDVRYPPGSPLVGAALHLQTNIPGPGVVNTFDIQGQGINDTGWTNLSFDFAGVTPGATTFSIHFNIAAGADLNAGGSVWIDNVRLTGTPQTGTPGCTDTNAKNYDAAATVDDNSCLYDVTFNVDMSCTSDTFTTVGITGPFCSWCADIAMTDDDNDDVYTVTLEVGGGPLEYKYIVDGFAGQEDLIGETGGCVGNTDGSSFANRVLDVTGNATVDEAYGQCKACPQPGDVLGCTNADANNYDAAATYDDDSCLFNATFNVDMNCAGVSYTTVGITGPFCSWCADIQMTDGDNDGIFSVNLEVPAGPLEYKYIIDGFAGQEDLIGDAGGCVGNTDGSSFANRVVDIAGSVTLDETYGQCADCGSGPPTGGGDIFSATFDDAASISGWNKVADATGAEASIAWSDVEGNPPGAMALSAQNPAQGAGKAYIFQYDATGLDYGGASEVTVSFDVRYPPGSPLVGAALHLQTNIPGPGVVNTFDTQAQGINDTGWTNLSFDFTGVTPGATTFSIHFNIAAGADQDAGGTVWIDNVRLVGTQPTGTPGCTDAGAKNYDAAATTDDGSCLYDVTFNVDMNCTGVSYTTVGITGPFCSWCNDIAMTDGDADGIYTVTLEVGGGPLEYKYIIDGFAGQEDLLNEPFGQDACVGNTDGSSFANRVYDVTGDATLDETYGQCKACPQAGDVLGCTDATANNYNASATYDDDTCLYDVTFNVDMNCAGVSYTTVGITGPFCSWCADIAMTDGDGDGVYTVTLEAGVGSLEYKYIIDGFAGQEDLIGAGSCVGNTDGSSFANRVATVTGVDTLDETYGQCTACGAGPADIFSATFDDASSVTGWNKVADATGAEASIAWSDVEGNPAGAMALSAQNPAAGAGKAYIFQYDATGLDYGGATDVTVSFDVRYPPGSPLVGAALHLQTNIPGPGVVNTFDIQGQGINDAGWTNLTFDFSGVTPGATTFSIHFNIAAGADQDAGGTVWVDNVTLTPN